MQTNDNGKYFTQFQKKLFFNICPYFEQYNE